MAKPLVNLRRCTPKGQVLPFVAITLAALLILILATISYGVLTLRTMRALAAADLAAHAGAMEVRVLPNGQIVPNGRGPHMARNVFLQHQPPHTSLVGVSCGLHARRPFCEVTVRVEGAFWAPDRVVKARALLVQGITQEGQ